MILRWMNSTYKYYKYYIIKYSMRIAFITLILFATYSNAFFLL